MDEDIFRKLRELIKKNRFENIFNRLKEIVVGQKDQNLLIGFEAQWNKIKTENQIGIENDSKENSFRYFLLNFISALEEKNTVGERQNINLVFIPPDNSPSSQCPNCKSYDTKSIYEGDKEIIQCSNCKTTSENYIPPTFKFTEEEIEENKKKGFSIEQFRLFNKNMLFSRYEIIRRKYDAAFNYAQEAIEIGFDHQEAWEYYALCYYYKTTNKDDIIKNKGKEILASLKTSKQKRVTEKYETSEIRKTIARGLKEAVDRRYGKIIHEDEAAREDLITYLKVWYICYEISGIINYLNKVLNELLKTIKLEWFELDFENGGVKTIDKSLLLGFNALNFLNKVINAIGAKSLYNEYIRQIELKAAEHLSSKVYSIYNKTLQNNNRENNYNKKNSDEETLAIINSIKKWLDIYQKNKNKVGIQSGLEELIGNKKISWFDLNKQGKIVVKGDIKNYDFDPVFYVKEFSRILNKKLSDQEKIIKTNISFHLNKENEQLIKYIFTKKTDNELKLLLVKNLINNIRRSYLATGNQQFVKDAILFFRDKKISRMFFKLDKTNIKDQFGYDFSTIHQVKKLCTWLSDTEWDERTTLEQIKKNLIEDEFERIQIAYKKIAKMIEQSDGRWHGEDVKDILRCIKKAQKLFLISGNDNHLIWAVQELAGIGKSGIHWFWRTRKNNKMVNFSIRLIIKEDLHLLWDELVELINTVQLYAPPVISKKASILNQVKEFLSRRKKV